MEMKKKYVIMNSIISGLAIVINLFFLAVFIGLSLDKGNDSALGLAFSLAIFIAMWGIAVIYILISIIFSLVTIKKNFITSIVLASANLLLTISTLIVILNI